MGTSEKVTEIRSKEGDHTDIAHSRKLCCKIHRIAKIDNSINSCV